MPTPEKLTKAIQTNALSPGNIDLLYGKKVDSSSQIGISERKSQELKTDRRMTLYMTS